MSKETTASIVRYLSELSSLNISQIKKALAKTMMAMNKGIGIRFFVLKLCGNESFWNNVVMN